MFGQNSGHLFSGASIFQNCALGKDNEIPRSSLRRYLQIGFGHSLMPMFLLFTKVSKEEQSFTSKYTTTTTKRPIGIKDKRKDARLNYRSIMETKLVLRTHMS